MKFFRLDQKIYSDFITPDRVNLILVSAESEQQARKLAEFNEERHRDGKQFWTSDYSTCVEIILPEEIAKVFLVS